MLLSAHYVAFNDKYDCFWYSIDAVEKVQSQNIQDIVK